MESIEPGPFAVFLNSIIRTPPDIYFYFFIGIQVVLLFLSGLISGSEVAFFSVTDKNFEKYRNGKTRKDRTVFQLLNKPKKNLATILWANNLINISIIILFTYFINRYFNLIENKAVSFFLEIILITLILVLFGELIPKIIANQKSRQFISLMAYPLDFLNHVFSPLSILLVNSTNLIEKRISKKGSELTVQDIHSAIDITATSAKTQEEKKILKRIVDFGNVTVKQIMISRMDVLAYETSRPFTEVVKDIAKNKFSRIPVFRNQPDNIEGILYIKDLLPHINKGDDFNWIKLLRKPYFVPQNKKIDDLLEEFQKNRVHIAIVVDEYGGFLGIVTLEDILEEIVGDMTDEVDEVEESQIVRKKNKNTFEFSGKALLTDLEKHLELPNNFFEDYKGEADTLGGLMIEHLKKIPVKGDKVAFKNLSFVVTAAGEKNVATVEVNVEHE